MMASVPMTDRLSCCIPGCRRTFKPGACGDATVIMCGRHWRMGDEAMRNRHKQVRKRLRWFQRKFRLGHKISRRPRFDAAWDRAAWANHFAWERVRHDVEIKVALGAEDAPRRRPRRAA
jgi:hypothetical protein